MISRRQFLQTAGAALIAARTGSAADAPRKKLAVVTNVWTNYAVQAQVRFSAGSYGGGLGAYDNGSGGTHYAAWIFPEGRLEERRAHERRMPPSKLSSQSPRVLVSPLRFVCTIDHAA